MKKLLSIVALLGLMAANAQSKDQRRVLAKASMLDETVFGTKDSLLLEKLFGPDVSYVHSSGKKENREEAIRNIVRNKSVYSRDIQPFPYHVSSRGDSLSVVHIFKAIEKKADGTESQLNISIETVWLKHKKDWKMARRQATKVN